MRLDFLKSVKELCFYEASNLPVECTRALKQEGRAQRLTCADISTAVCVHMQGARVGACRNVLGFCSHFGFSFKARELHTSV